MSQFQMPITIDQALGYIQSDYYLLPAFQREFKWDAERIEKLFDSLMRGYPTNSMLFWSVRGDTKTQWKFYQFLDNFVFNAMDYAIPSKVFNTSNATDFIAVLDGQQRLTAMRIGLYGKYAYHEPRKSWKYSEESFPERTLYLNLSKKGGPEDECLYLFSFKKDKETGCEDFYTDSENSKWFRVGAVVPYHRSNEEISDFFENAELTKDQRTIIKRLETTVFNDKSVTYYLEEEQDPDKAVKIFTRINSGGIALNFSDIVFSLMVANWTKVNAKEKIQKLINDVGEKGFSIDKDYIVKAFLFLLHKSIKTEIRSFNKIFCEKVEGRWDDINSAILSLFDLLRSFGLTSFSLTSNNATLPLLYYIYHKKIYDDFTNKVAYEDDRAEMKRWLYSTIIRRTFGGQSDSVLNQARKAFTDNFPFEDNPGEYITLGLHFDGKLIDSKIVNLTTVDDEFLNKVISIQKDDKYAFPVLSLLYPHLDYKNNNFHKDHLHAEALYDSLPEEVKMKYSFYDYNSILNLQMLDKNENESKGKMPLADWVNNECKDTDTRERFLKSHLIPDVDLSLSNFEEYAEQRRIILKKRLSDILNGEVTIS